MYLFKDEYLSYMLMEYQEKDTMTSVIKQVFVGYSKSGVAFALIIPFIFAGPFPREDEGIEIVSRSIKQTLLLTCFASFQDFKVRKQASKTITIGFCSCYLG